MLYRAKFNSSFKGAFYEQGKVYEMDEETAKSIDAVPVDQAPVEEKMVEKGKDKMVKKGKNK